MSTTLATNSTDDPSASLASPNTAIDPTLPTAAARAHPHSHAANAVAFTLRTITLAAAAIPPVH